VRAWALVVLMAMAAASPAMADPAEAWRKYCLSCHGAQGSGETKAGRNHKLPDMRTSSWQSSLSDEEVLRLIRDGKKDTKMKPFGRKLSEADLKALVARIRSYAAAPAASK